MKITRSEFGHEYEQYRFGYCEYATLEKGDRDEDFYEQGYLPYSVDPKTKGTFYMARSARLLLPEFSLSSENRRIAKRFDDTLMRRQVTGDDAEVRQLFVDYFAARHGKTVMPPERLDAVLSWPLPLRVFRYERDNELIAVTIEVVVDNSAHFWFSAYDLALVEQSLGMWLMLDGARNAKTEGRAQYYLGTVYGCKALYKTNLGPLEFWDGSGWNNDIALLKKLARAESE